MTQPPHIVHTKPSEWPSIAAGRFANNVRREGPSGCELALLGLPDDTGVRLNGGRPGAALGPLALRRALANYGTPWDSVARRSLDVLIFDAGDVEPAEGDDAAALVATHERVEAAVLALHRLGLTPLCIGGGHDLSLPSVTALSTHFGNAVGGINVDAHLDVRERVGSGMPFRRLIESGALEPKRFIEFGVGRFANDAADFAWLEAQGATVVSVDAARASNAPQTEVMLDSVLGDQGVGFLSIDLDGLDAGVVSGVSAINPDGLDVARVAALAEVCGANEKVRHFDIMELAPELDPSGRSARVAAHLLLCFVAGFSRRLR